MTILLISMKNLIFAIIGVAGLFTVMYYMSEGLNKVIDEEVEVQDYIDYPIIEGNNSIVSGVSNDDKSSLTIENFPEMTGKENDN